jgi:hypothetical protein
MSTDLIPFPNPQELVSARPSRLELAIVAWLDAKQKRSGSAKTARAYHDTTLTLGEYLASQALNLAGCTNDLAHTIAFLGQHPLLRDNLVRTVEWLQDNGGSFDCRVLPTIVARAYQMTAHPEIPS